MYTCIHIYYTVGTVNNTDIVSKYVFKWTCCDMVPAFMLPGLEVVVSELAVPMAVDVPGIDSTISPVSFEKLETAGEVKPVGSSPCALEIMAAAVFEVLVFEALGVIELSTKGVERVAAVNGVWEILPLKVSLGLALLLLEPQAGFSRSVKQGRESRVNKFAL